MSKQRATIEADRLTLQTERDSHKSQADRNKLGQFATPTELAREVLEYGLSLLPDHAPIRFFDPAIGTGSFYSALLSAAAQREIESARGFEIDPHYGKPAVSLWKNTSLEIKIADFTTQRVPKAEHERANLLICNPPYVRHHHLAGSEKVRLQVAARDAANVSLSGLAGLYCYFMALSHAWMAKDAVAGWLIPSEFMDVNYGRALKEYLLREVTLLHIHRFDPNDVQFDDALVSSAVVWFKNRKAPVGHSVEFSYGGTLKVPAVSKRISVPDLERSDKWTRFPKQKVQERNEGYRLADLFSIKRGLATGDNSFFILSESKVEELQLPRRYLRPVLPSARYIKSDEISCDKNGVPLLERRQFLIDCDLSQEELELREPALWRYLRNGLEAVAPRYLCRSRRLWYSQERRPASPILCTYIGRSDHDGRPFRFLLNHSTATATNVFLMLYPTALLARHIEKHPAALRAAWTALNKIGRETLLGSGRVYGGGMHKLEPRELANVPADDLASAIGLPGFTMPHQLPLTGTGA
jgi:adenine-specific DNA-methyltransferase